MNTRLRKSITFTSVSRASPPDAVYMIPLHRDPACPIHRSRLTGLACCSYKRSLIKQRMLLFTQISPRRASPVRRASPSHINRPLFTFMILFVVEANIEDNRIYPVSMGLSSFQLQIPLKQGRYGADEMFIVVV